MEARLPGRRAKYPNSRPLVSYQQNNRRYRRLGTRLISPTPTPPTPLRRTYRLPADVHPAGKPLRYGPMGEQHVLAKTMWGRRLEAAGAAFILGDRAAGGAQG